MKVWEEMKAVGEEKERLEKEVSKGREEREN